MNRVTSSCLCRLTAAVLTLVSSAASAQSIDYCNTFPIPTAATDQFGTGFTVAELSGATWLGPQVGTGRHYACVLDNSNKVVIIEVTPNSTGFIQSITLVRGLTLSQTHDNEGIVYDSTTGNIIISDEDTPALREYSLTTGVILRTFTTPAIYNNRRSNLGLESLALSPDGSTMWTANEEALSVDGPVSSQTTGTLVRLQRYTRSDTTPVFTPDLQHAYLTAPIHGSTVSGTRNGLSELTSLPGGALIALERSFAISVQGFYLSRMYLVHTSAAGDTSGLATINTAGVVPVAKQLTFTRSLNNLEGLSVGPLLQAAGTQRIYFMLGVLDDGDPITSNQAVGFAVTVTVCPADYNEDGGIDGADVDQYFADWSAANPAADVNNDGGVDGADVGEFFSLWSAGGC